MKNEINTFLIYKFNKYIEIKCRSINFFEKIRN